MNLPTNINNIYNVFHDGVFIVSITARTLYSNQSFEEIRLDDLNAGLYHGSLLARNNLQDLRVVQPHTEENNPTNLISSPIPKCDDLKLENNNNKNKFTVPINNEEEDEEEDDYKIEDIKKLMENLENIQKNIKNSCNDINNKIDDCNNNYHNINNNNNNNNNNNEDDDGKMKFKTQNSSLMVKELKDQLVCGICHELFYKCVTLLPCMHSFCSFCYGECRMRSRNRYRCPQCREFVTEVGNNRTINNIIDTLLKSNPDLKRDQLELEEMDKNNKLVILDGKVILDNNGPYYSDFFSLNRERPTHLLIPNNATTTTNRMDPSTVRVEPVQIQPSRSFLHTLYSPFQSFFDYIILLFARPPNNNNITRLEQIINRSNQQSQDRLGEQIAHLTYLMDQRLNRENLSAVYPNQPINSLFGHNPYQNFNSPLNRPTQYNNVSHYPPTPLNNYPSLFNQQQTSRSIDEILSTSSNVLNENQMLHSIRHPNSTLNDIPTSNTLIPMEINQSLPTVSQNPSIFESQYHTTSNFLSQNNTPTSTLFDPLPPNPFIVNSNNNNLPYTNRLFAPSQTTNQLFSPSPQFLHNSLFGNQTPNISSHIGSQIPLAQHSSNNTLGHVNQPGTTPLFSQTANTISLFGQTQTPSNVYDHQN